MNEQVKQLILDTIKEYQKIIICRHKRPDGDAIGSTTGLKRILQLTFPEKDVRVINSDYSSYINFLPSEDEPIPAEEYADALVIVCDTGNVERISNPLYNCGKKLIKIDHHIDDRPYGDISWVEEERSSVCEMIADFYRTFSDELVLDKQGATAIYTGMVTDSGRFRYSETSGETLRNAAALLDLGIDTETLYARLYLDDFAFLKFKAWTYDKMQMTQNGVATLFLSLQDQEKFSLSPEEASNCVSFLDSIKGSLIWLAFIECADGSIRVRLRSRFVACQPIATHYNGGGHANASGATVYSIEEMNALIAEADEVLKNYKENNTGWL